MAVRTITVTIPEVLYLQLEAAARSTAQPVETVVAQSLERTLPTHLKVGLPMALQVELDAMEHLSDDALRALAFSVESPDHARQRDELLQFHQQQTISADQQTTLTALQAEAEALMVRKAHAFVLLKSRGHAPPPIDQLPVPTP